MARIATSEALAHSVTSETLEALASFALLFPEEMEVRITRGFSQTLLNLDPIR
jgi:hypothetical protein